MVGGMLLGQPDNDCMQTLPVQLADAVASSLAASTGVGSAAPGDASFTITLGRALASVPDAVPGGASISPKTSPGSSRSKETASGGSDPSSMATILLNCFSATITPTGPQLPPDSTSTRVSDPSASAGEGSANAGAPSIARGTRAVSVPGTLTAGSDSGPGVRGTTRTDSPDSSAPERGQNGNQLSSTPARTDQPSQNTATLQSASVLDGSPGNQLSGTAARPDQPSQNTATPENAGVLDLSQEMHGSPRFIQSPEPQVGAAVSEMTWVQPSNYKTSGASGLQQKSLVASKFEVSGSKWERSDSAPVQTAPQSPSGQYSQVASTPALNVSPVVRPPSTPDSSDRSPQQLEHPGLLGSVEGAEKQAADASAPNASPVRRPPYTPATAGLPPEQVGDPSLLGRVEGTDAQADDASAPSASPVVRPPSPPNSTGSPPEQVGDPSLLGRVEAADEQAADASGLNASPVGRFTSASSPTAADPLPPASQANHPASAEFASMLEQLAGAGMSVKVSGNAPPSDGTEKPGKAAVVMVSPSGTFTKPAVDVAPIPGVPKVEGLVNTPAKDPHLAQASKLPTELPGTQVAPDQSALAPATSAASSTPVASSPAETNSQAATAEANGDTDAPSLSNNIAPSGAASAVPTESTTPASLADLPASSQWKSGQRDGTGAQDNPAAPKTPNFTNNPAGDSVPNFLAAQAPGVPASHDKAEAAQLPPSSTQAPETLSAWQNYDGGAGSIVRSASLSGSANGAEMHVELRTGALGPMEVHAVLNGRIGGGRDSCPGSRSPHAAGGGAAFARTRAGRAEPARGKHHRLPGPRRGRNGRRREARSAVGFFPFAAAPSFAVGQPAAAPQRGERFFGG